jgi:hypothetical protein
MLRGGYAREARIVLEALQKQLVFADLAPDNARQANWIFQTPAGTAYLENTADQRSYVQHRLKLVRIVAGEEADGTTHAASAPASCVPGPLATLIEHEVAEWTARVPARADALLRYRAGALAGCG